MHLLGFARHFVGLLLEDVRRLVVHSRILGFPQPPRAIFIVLFAFADFTCLATTNIRAISDPVAKQARQARIHVGRNHR